LEEPIVKAEDGYIAVKVVEKIFESAKKGQAVKIV
jgi:predicted dehydrogenase